MEGDVSYLMYRIRKGEIEQALLKTPKFVRIAERTYLARTPEDFVSAIIRFDKLYPPVWKVIVPGIDPETKELRGVGANYYIVHMKSKHLFKTDEKVAVYFRGTYGYSGSGCYESAFIEKALKMMELPVEVRDGDYLLTLLLIGVKE